MLTRMLTAEGHTTVTASDGIHALQQLARRDVDLILLDLVMPNSHGMQVLTHLNARNSTTPVIVLSAVTDVSARLEAFDLGAIDFVGKPFHQGELVARVRRHLETPKPPSSAESGGATAGGSPDHGRFLVVGGIRLDLDRRQAHQRGDQVSLTEREFLLLAHLMRRHGEVCSRCGVWTSTPAATWSRRTSTGSAASWPSFRSRPCGRSGTAWMPRDRTRQPGPR